jgi:hypothetical protein
MRFAPPKNAQEAAQQKKIEQDWLSGKSQKPASKLISKPKLSSFKGIGQKLSASRMAKGGAVGSKLSSFKGIGKKLASAPRTSVERPGLPPGGGRPPFVPATSAQVAAADAKAKEKMTLANIQKQIAGRRMAKGGAVGSKTKAKRK